MDIDVQARRKKIRDIMHLILSCLLIALFLFLALVG